MECPLCKDSLLINPRDNNDVIAHIDTISKLSQELKALKYHKHVDETFAISKNTGCLLLIAGYFLVPYFFTLSLNFCCLLVQWENYLLSFIHEWLQIRFSSLIMANYSWLALPLSIISNFSLDFTAIY
jgi:hypothetical protein